MPSSWCSHRHLTLLVVAVAASGGCRTRPEEPVVDRFTPRVVACADPVNVSVNVSAPVLWVGSGDFNGDGAPDLVGASNGISFAYGLGNGSFDRASDPAYRLVRSFVATADFDRDGVDDLVMARAGKELELYRGVKNAQFPQSTSVLPGFNPAATWLAAGDVDGDHIQDAVVLELEPGRRAATVLYGRDGGDFEAPFRFPLPADPRGFIAVADIDANGRGELLVPFERGVLITHNLGKRTDFLGWYVVELPAPAAALAFGDFDEDGALDMAAVATLKAGNNVFTSRGNGQGAFEAPHAMRAGDLPRSLVAIDWNLDGHLDLVVVNSDRDHTASFFYGRGDGTFSDPQTCFAVNFDATGGANWITSADFDRDGRPDLAFAYYNGLTVVLNRLE